MVAGLLFFLSGFSALIYQVVWVRMFSLVFGVTVLAVSTVVAVFMAGLGLGSIHFGRRVDTHPRPLALYGFLEIGIGLFAAVLPGLVLQLEPAAARLYRVLGADSAMLVLARLGLCFVLLFLPTFLMGGTLPVIVRFCVRRRELVGLGIGTLYALNTFGAVVGCVLGGMVLPQWVPISRIIAMPVAVNLCAGLVAVVMGLRGAAEADAVPVTADYRSSTVSFDYTYTRGSLRLAMTAFCIASFAALAYETLWTRALIPRIGNDTYAFSIIVATFLVGLSLGAAFFGSRVREWRQPLFGLGLVELSLAALVPVCLWLMGLAGYEAGRPISEGATTWQTLFIKALAAGGVILAPTILMGAKLPVLVHVATGSLARLGRSTGAIYLANTLAAMLGSLAAGFILLPGLGLRGSFIAATAMSAGAGLLLLFAEQSPRLSWKPAAPLSVLFVCWLLPSSLFGPNAVSMAAVGQRLLYHREWVEGSLTVAEDVEHGYKTLSVNGYVTAWTTPEDIRVHKMLAYVPILLAHNTPHNALIIGFGLGVTARSAVETGLQVDCVELMRGEIETADLFADVNGHVLADPHLRLIIGDGRNYVLGTERMYDIISSNAVYPEFSPSLYTREFYELCRERLRPGGVMCVWLPTNLRTFKAGLRTFQSVFSHATLWYCNPGHMLVVGTFAERKIDFDELSQRIAEPALRADLAGTHLDDPYVFLTSMLLSESGLRRYVGDGPLHTDDFPLMEFHITSEEEMAEVGIRNVMDALAVPLQARQVVGGEPDLVRLLQRYWDVRRAIMRFKTYLWYGSNVQGQMAQAALQRMGAPLPHLKPLLDEEH